MRWMLSGPLWLMLTLSAHAQTLPPDLDLVQVATGLNGAVGIRHAGDGSGRLFVVRQGGTIRVIDASGATLTTPFLNVGSGGTAPPLGFSTGGERGLLGLAFHPDYAVNGRFFVYYNDANGDSVIAEYAVSSGNPNIADASSGQVILRIYQPFSNHNGGDVHFGPDGYLYIAMGDGGSGNDPCNSGQSLDTSTLVGCAASGAFLGTPPAGVPRGNASSRALLGKMLRIDIDIEQPRTPPPAGADLCGADADSGIARYDIPPGNPFAGDNGSNAAACDETFHYGLRNPFRFSFDRVTDDLIIGDVGQSSWEEIDLVGPTGGRNFGWKICEGFHVRGSTSTLCTLAGRTDPILAYGRGTGFSTTGGFRYRGPYPQLDGVLFFADFGGALFAQIEGGGGWSSPPTPWRTGQGDIAGFGEDEGGSVYVATLSGTIRRFVLGTPPPAQLTINKFAQLTTDNGVIGLADPGDVITYTVNALNSGGETLTSLGISDSLNGGTPFALSCTPTTLTPNASASCTAYTHLVTPQEFDAGLPLVNDALGSALDPAMAMVAGSDSTTVNLAPPRAELQVSKSAVLDPDNGIAGAADAGDGVTYTISVLNSGNLTLHSLAVVDQPQGGAVAALNCTPTTLAPGQTASCDPFAIIVTQDQVEAQQDLVNVATATARDPDETLVEDSDQAVVQISPALPVLQVSKLAVLSTDLGTSGRADVDDVISYDVTISNIGNVRLELTGVLDQLNGAAPVALNCAPTLIQPGASASCDAYQHLVTQVDFDARVDLVNTATANATRVGGGETQVAADEASIPIGLALPALIIDKSAALVDGDADNLADAGESIDYSFSVLNDGNVTLTGVQVDDPQLGGVVACAPATLAPGESSTCGPVSYNVTANDLTGTSIDNSATARGMAPMATSATVSAPDTTSVPTDPGDPIFADGFED